MLLNPCSGLLPVKTVDVICLDLGQRPEIRKNCEMQEGEGKKQMLKQFCKQNLKNKTSHFE